MNSILTSIKLLLGLVEEYEPFDVQIIMCINNAFSILSQLGVGPSNGFSILDKSANWSDYEIAGDMLESVKMYVFIKTKLLFDPPSNSFTLDSLKTQASELEWRLNVDSDPPVEQESIDEEV